MCGKAHRGQRRCGRPTQEEQTAKRLATGEQASDVILRDMPARAAVVALPQGVYIEDELQTQAQKQHEREEKQASAPLPLYQTLTGFANALGVALPVRLSRRVLPFTPEELQNDMRAVRELFGWVQGVAVKLIGTAIADPECLAGAVGSFHSSFTPDANDAEAQQLTNNVARLALVSPSPEVRTNCSAVLSQLPRKKARAAIEKEERKLEPEVRTKINTSRRTEWKPRRGKDGNLLAQRTLKCIGKLKKSELERRTGISRRQFDAARADWELLRKGGFCAPRKLYKSRVTMDSMMATLGWIKARCNSFHPGCTQMVAIQGAVAGRLSFFDRQDALLHLWKEYMEDKSPLPVKRVGRGTFYSLVKATTRRSKALTCVSAFYARGLEGLDEILAMVARVREIWMAKLGPNNSDKADMYRQDGCTTFEDIKARTIALREHIESRQMARHVIRPLGEGGPECDGDSLHCARHACGLPGCGVAEHTPRCQVCADAKRLSMAATRVAWGVLNALQRLYPNDESLSTAGASRDDDAPPAPVVGQATATKKTHERGGKGAKAGAPRKEFPAEAAEMMRALLLGSPTLTAKAIEDQVFNAMVAGKINVTKSQVRTALKRLAVKVVPEGGGPKQWMLLQLETAANDAQDVEVAPLSPPETTTAATTTITTTTTTTAMTPLVKVKGVYGDELSQIICTIKVWGAAPEHYAAHVMRAGVQLSAEQFMIQKLKSGVGALNMDFKMKQVPLKSLERQSDFFGKRGMDLLGCVLYVTETDPSDPSKLRVKMLHLDLVLTTSEHTVANFVTLLPIIMRFAAEHGVHTLDIWTDGAANFKSLHLLPLVVEGNANEWGSACKVFVRSWNYSESGEGKGPVDVHFSYLNMFVRKQLDGGKDVTMLEEYYDTLTRNGRREQLMANTTTMLVDVVASQMPKKTLSGQDWPTPRTMHRIEFVPLEKDAPDDATIATVSRI